MEYAPVPVILIHGWNSHPGVWNRLTPRLDAADLPWEKFDHSGMKDANLETIALALGEFLQEKRRENGWHDRIDIICHSVGTCIARYLLEVCDGATKKERVRQLIGLGPPNNGSALAELFHDPDRGPAVIDHLTGIFVPKGFDPATDPIVQDVRPASRPMHQLRAAGIRHDITYRIIVTSNPDGREDFFPLFAGRTWELGVPPHFRQTLQGDGIVPHKESSLPGISLDIITASREENDTLPPPNLYCHINLPKNPRVVDRIMEYLTSPGISR